MNGHRDHWHGGARRGHKGAAVELADLGHLRESALGEENQGLAGGRQLQDAARIDPTLVPVEAFDELRAQAPEQQAGEGHPDHFLLDHEGKVGRQRGSRDQTVDVAGMIGHHHAGNLGQPLQPFDGEWDAGQMQEGARNRPGHQPALAQARNEQIHG